jgi:hypothetical protein
MAVVDALSPEQRARQECDVRERGHGWRWPVVDSETLASGPSAAPPGLARDKHMR